MQRFSDNLPRVGHSAAKSGRAIISFRTQAGPSLLWGGAEMHPTNIVRHGEGESTFQRSSGSASWGAMSLPMEVAAAVGETLAGSDVMPPRNATLITPRPSAMARLQRLHAAAGSLAENAPEIIANPDAARGLEQALIEAMVGCLDASPEARTAWRKGSTRSSCAAFAGWWRRIPTNRFISQRYARRSGFRAAHCGDAARSIWRWAQNATCCCAACIWHVGRYAAHPMRHQ